MLLNFGDRGINIDELKNITKQERKSLRHDRDVFNIIHLEKLQLNDKREAILNELLAIQLRMKELTNDMVRIDASMNINIDMILSRKSERAYQNNDDVEQEEGPNKLEEYKDLKPDND